MATQTTRDILDKARLFHRQMFAFYEALKDRMDQPRILLILDYLCRHEERMSAALKTYEHQAAESVMNALFRFTLDLSVESFLRSVPAGPDLSLNDLMRIAIQLENYLIHLYRQAVAHAVSEDVKNVFEHLLNETLKDRSHLSLALVDMQDL